jgi:chromosome segregation ATPase
MAPAGQAKTDPLTLLLDEIELLSAQTRSLELSLKRAHTSAFEEVEKIQEQFRAKVSSLKAEFDERKDSVATAPPGATAVDAETLSHSKNEELLRRFAEQQNLIQRAQEECDRRGAAIVALREQLGRLEGTNRELEQAADLRLAQARQELQSQVAGLQDELARKDENLQQLQSALRAIQGGAPADVRHRLDKPQATEESAAHWRGQLESAERERNALRERLAVLESTHEQSRSAAERELDGFRHDAHAKITALQSEITHKTALLTQHQSTIARLEEELKAFSQIPGQQQETQRLLEAQVTEIARRDHELAELRAAAEQQKGTAAEAARGRAEIDALRTELRQKQLELAQRETAQSAEQEVRNRYRELQGRLAAKESVIESQEYHLRSAQAQLLAARDALAEKELALAEAQARVRGDEQGSEEQLEQWQGRLSEAQSIIERYRGENEKTQADLNAALESQRKLEHEHSAMRERAAQLSAQVDELTAASHRAREALYAEIVELQSRCDQQQASLEERQAALHQLEQTLRVEIHSLKEQSAAQQLLLQTSSADLAGAREEANALRARLAQLEPLARDADAATQRAQSDAEQIALLGQQLELARDQLGKREAALELAAQELEHAKARGHEPSAAEEQSAPLKAAQAQVAELLDRLAQLEAARETLQENARHELQQLRESFETRIAKLRMELAAKGQPHSQEVAAADSQITIARLQEEFNKQLQELHGQLAEQHVLLENRNEELIRVKAELEAMQEPSAQPGRRASEASDNARSVELREEDALEPARRFVNGLGRPNILNLHAEHAGAHEMISTSEHLGQWHSQHSIDSAFGSTRRWNLGLFKRRWRA